jgi:hypothetical protein
MARALGRQAWAKAHVCRLLIVEGSENLFGISKIFKNRKFSRKIISIEVRLLVRIL